MRQVIKIIDGETAELFPSLAAAAEDAGVTPYWMGRILSLNRSTGKLNRKGATYSYPINL